MELQPAHGGEDPLGIVSERRRQRGRIDLPLHLVADDELDFLLEPLDPGPRVLLLRRESGAGGEQETEESDKQRAHVPPPMKSPQVYSVPRLKRMIPPRDMRP